MLGILHRLAVGLAVLVPLTLFFGFLAVNKWLAAVALIALGLVGTVMLGDLIIDLVRYRRQRL